MFTTLPVPGPPVGSVVGNGLVVSGGLCVLRPWLFAALPGLDCVRFTDDSPTNEVGCNNGAERTLTISQTMSMANADWRSLDGLMLSIINHLFRGVVIAYG